MIPILKYQKHEQIKRGVKYSLIGILGVLLSINLIKSDLHIQGNRLNIKIESMENSGVHENWLSVQCNNGNSYYLVGINKIPHVDNDRLTKWCDENLLGESVVAIVQHKDQSNEPEGVGVYLYLANGDFVNEQLIEKDLATFDSQADHDLKDWFRRLRYRQN